jgi:hypothetical protein
VIVAQLYSVYLDESGTHKGSDAVVVAGFISNATKWNAFSIEWKAALDAWGVPMFHMADFENWQGCFASWSKDDHKSHLNHLLETIKRHTFSSIAFVVRKKSFDKILSDRAKRLCGDAYGLASIGCWYNLRQVVKESRVDGYIDYTMESGSKGRSALAWIYGEQSKYLEWVEDTRMFSLSFRDKRLILPLQAADILAYEIYKQTKRQFGRDKRPERYPLKQLNIPSRQWHYADDTELKSVDDYLNSLWNEQDSRG